MTGLDIMMRLQARQALEAEQFEAGIGELLDRFDLVGIEENATIGHVHAVLDIRRHENFS